MALEDLAVAVLLRAIEDVEAGRPDVRAHARHFLAGGPMFEFWCHAANARPAVIQRALTRRRTDGRG